MLAVIYIIVIALLLLIIYLGTKRGGMRHFFEAHPQVPRFLLSAYIVFAGCFVFPIRSEPYPLDFQKAYSLAASYGAIALASAGIFGMGQGRRVWITTLSLTAVGMLLRYLLEFGEVSNTYNFTPFNIISYLVLLPAGTAIAYHWIAGALRRSNE